MTSLLKEGHKDLTYITVRCRVKIEEVEDPTILDITTDMRALPGIVTVRQTRPVSDIISSEGHRIIELNVSYIPKFIDAKDPFLEAVTSLKRVDGVNMIKVIEHDDQILNNRLQKRPLIL